MSLKNDSHCLSLHDLLPPSMEGGLTAWVSHFSPFLISVRLGPALLLLCGTQQTSSFDPTITFCSAKCSPGKLLSQPKFICKVVVMMSYNGILWLFFFHSFPAKMSIRMGNEQKSKPNEPRLLVVWRLQTKRTFKPKANPILWKSEHFKSISLLVPLYLVIKRSPGWGNLQFSLLKRK